MSPPRFRRRSRAAFNRKIRRRAPDRLRLEFPPRMILGVIALIGITLTGGEQDSASARLLREADETFRARKYPEALDGYRRAAEAAAGDKNLPAQVESLS